MTAADESTKGEQGLDALRPSPVRGWRRRLRLPLMLLGPAIVVVVAAYLYLTGGRFEATDDAGAQDGEEVVEA